MVGSVFRWWALRGFLFVDCPAITLLLADPLNNPPRIQGQAPKNPSKSHPPIPLRVLTGGCSFCPFGGRNASAAAGQMRWSFLLGGLIKLLMGITVVL